MARGKSTAEDTQTLKMALVGYEIEKQKLEEKIREIQGALEGGGTPSTPAAAPKKRKLSAAARRRIGAAQKKRWAAHRKAQAGKGK